MSQPQNPHQIALQQRCFHPDGGFISFSRASLKHGIPARFEEQVRLYADRPAIVSSDSYLSYEQLNCTANTIAHTLLANSDHSGQAVALLVEHGAVNIAACLGVLKAGKAFVPLDTHWPINRIAWILNHSRATVVCTTTHNLPLARKIVQAGQRIVVLDELHSLTDQSNPKLAINADDPAYILYTSGSTGHPKGVLDSHRNLLHEVMRLTNSLHICPHDRQTLLRANSAGAVSDTFTALLNGAALYPFDVLHSGVNALSSWLKREQMTVWRSTPSLFRAMASTLYSDEQLPHLRILFLCGEAANSTDLDGYRDHCVPSCLFVNCLGSTEAATVTLYFSDHNSLARLGVLPVGYPVDDMQVQIVNESGDVINGIGEGEIVIRSQYLTCGYFDDPALTKKAFQDDPEIPGYRRFFSGDIGNRQEDGNLVCLGRRDWRVNIRGRSFELAEVEATLSGMHRIREAVATLATDARGSTQVVAYIVPDVFPGPSSIELRSYLAEQIPAYMIPSRFICLDSIPLTATGKADHKALSAQDIDHGYKPGDTALPVTHLESELIHIWQRLFQREDIGRLDDFFALGGDSLLALQLVEELETVSGYSLPIAALFQSPTIEALSQMLGEENGASPSRSLVAMQSDGSKPPLFFVHGVGGDAYIFLNLARRLAPDQPVYGLQAVGLEGQQSRHTSVEEMAIHYAGEICSLQTEGPYHISGYSTGGWFAYAVAEELQRQGKRVALLVLIDTGATCNLPWLLYARVMAPHLIQRACFHLRKLMNPASDNRLRYIKQRLGWFWIHLTRAKKRFPVRQTTVDQFPLPDQDKTLEYYNSLLVQFRPGKYTGDVILIVGEDINIQQHSRFWKHFVRGRLQIRRISGIHITLLAKRNAEGLAKVFRETLAESRVLMRKNKQ